MPIYEYACSDCFHEFEVMQKMSDEPVKACPECGQERAKRLVSAPKFKLKGSGWYETDFKNKPTKTDNKSSDTKPATENKSDSKTGAKD